MAFEGDPGGRDASVSTGKQRGTTMQRWKATHRDGDSEKTVTGKETAPTMEGFPVLSGSGFISL